MFRDLSLVRLSCRELSLSTTLFLPSIFYLFIRTFFVFSDKSFIFYIDITRYYASQNICQIRICPVFDLILPIRDTKFLLVPPYKRHKKNRSFFYKRHKANLKYFFLRTHFVLACFLQGKLIAFEGI